MMISTEEFQRKGQQVNLDAMNLDTAFLGVLRNNSSAIPAGESLTWKAIKGEWDTYFRENIQKTPFMPWQSTTDLDTWIATFERWKSNLKTWVEKAPKSTSQTKGIVDSIPESPATIEYKRVAAEELAASKKGTPGWMWMLFGIGALGAIGYSLSSVARIAGR